MEAWPGMFKSSSFDLKILITKVKIGKEAKQSCIHQNSVCRHEREHGLNMTCPRSSNTVYPIGISKEKPVATFKNVGFFFLWHHIGSPIFFL